MENIFNEPEGVYNKDRDFTSLVCWQDARNVKLFFYNNILPLLPKEEKFNLDIQVRKSTCSSTANIAEGYGNWRNRWILLHPLLPIIPLIPIIPLYHSHTFK